MNSSDNPPDYNPDIINNQLITTFGTTTAPNNYAFGSVNVRPTPQQHLEHTFNTTDLTQEAIELAIDDAPGLDVHTIGINQEQIVGNGAPINESALTIINWGKYRLRTLGLHQIATADNSNNWVVPALMEVSIPLIQNQIIDHSGTYRIVQRTIQGETGLFIEEYIPEPEPEEEILENNSNTRVMIIDENEEMEEEENNNNGQIVLRGQNNVRGLPDPTGEAIEGTFNINISPPTITTPIIYNGYYKFDGNTLISGTDQDYNIYINIPQNITTSYVLNYVKLQINERNVWVDSETIGISNFETNVTKTFEPGRNSTIAIFYYNKNTNQMIAELTSSTLNKTFDNGIYYIGYMFKTHTAMGYPRIVGYGNNQSNPTDIELFALIGNQNNTLTVASNIIINL